MLGHGAAEGLTMPSFYDVSARAPALDLLIGVQWKEWSRNEDVTMFSPHSDPDMAIKQTEKVL